MSQAARIHVTFPVLNEEAMLESSIERTIAYCEQHKLEIDELCIADNGSTDRTAEIGQTLAARHRNVRYLRVGKRGFGLALKTAWGATQADFVGYMDIDLATDLRHLKEVCDHITRGEQVGRMGSTGRSTGNHLHYEVRIDGRAVNPIPFMKSTDYVLAMQRRSGAASMDAVAIGGPVSAQK